jgi:CheY-like chemotaxis protein
MVDRQVAHLVRLVDDLVDASRISRGKLVLSRQPVELTGLIAAAIESVRSPLSEDPHELVVSLPPAPVFVEADPVRLTQVFLNLVSNAIKFTPAGGKVTVTVECVAGGVEVRIKDTGRGIAPQDLAHVFEMFYQGVGERSGLGLGLTLVKTLVEMHGGKVTARSAGKEQGSEFTVALPVVADAVAEAAETTPRSPQAGGRRVLIVDDNRDAVDSLAELLRMFEYDVQTAYDGRTAVDAASRFRPDIAVLDIGMPQVDGYATARALRGQPGGGDVLLVAMTGWGQAEDKRRAMEAGFDAHLVKPVSFDALLEVFARDRGDPRAARAQGLVVPFAKGAPRKSGHRA